MQGAAVVVWITICALPSGGQIWAGCWRGGTETPQAATLPVSGLTRLQVLLCVVVNSAGSAWKHLVQPGVDRGRDCSIGAAQFCLSSWWAGGFKPQCEVCIAYLQIQTVLCEEYPLPYHAIAIGHCLLTLLWCSEPRWQCKGLQEDVRPEHLSSATITLQALHCYLTPCSRTCSNFLCCSPHKAILYWHTINQQQGRRDRNGNGNTCTFWKAITVGNMSDWIFPCFRAPLVL